MLKKLFSKIREITPKQLVVAGVFTLALTGAIGLGLANRQSARAEEVRDCDHGNSIINVGPCGALTREEFISDVRANNSQQKDLQTVYADSRIGGLQGDADYNRFATQAVHGILKRNGELWVNNELVATNAWTMGRDNYPGRTAISIGNRTYYMSTPDVSFADHRQQLDVMVLFDENGTVEIAVIEACGNPVPRMDKITSKLDCKALNKVEVAGKKNTYKFNTTIHKEGLAKVVKVEYFIDGKLWTTKNTAEEMTDEYTFTKASSEVSVKVTYSLPGGNSKTTEFKIECKKTIEVAQPFYTCERLIATARDDTNRKFRFTVQAVARDGATLKDVDFSVDGVTKNTGVTQKDAQGRIFQDYDFDDGKKHTIVAKVKFNVNDKVESKLCQAEVTSKEKPVCPYNPQLPPDDERCKEPPKECKPGVPVGHPDCAPLPKTGPGSLVGLFAGASIFGTAAHRIFLRFRGHDEE